ncbi:MAG: ABC transporter permease [Planctomycetales bacterium]|nr:ABC transporter permease [Planctomycetales bacterium]
MIPLRYSVRNLFRRKTRTVLTALGVSLGVFVGVGMLAVARSLRAAIARSGDPGNVLVHSRTTDQMELSSLDAGLLEGLRALPGVRAGPDGTPLASPEIYAGTIVSLPGLAAERLGVVRGVTAAAAPVHGRVRVGGGWPSLRGNRALVGALAATKLGVPPGSLAPGGRVRFEGTEWEVTGRFEAPGTTVESEIWVDLEDLRTAMKRQDLTHVVLAMADAAAARALVAEIPYRTDLKSVAARTEERYYAAYADSMRPLSVFAALLAALVAAGGGFAALNTMSANVAMRVREIGTLRALGFSTGAVVASLAAEALVLSLASAAAGSGLVAAFRGLPLQMSMGAFRLELDWELLGVGLGIGAAVGILGGVLPAWRGLARPIAEAVRAA